MSAVDGRTCRREVQYEQRYGGVETPFLSPSLFLPCFPALMGKDLPCSLVVPVPVSVQLPPLWDGLLANNSLLTPHSPAKPLLPLVRDRAAPSPRAPGAETRHGLQDSAVVFLVGMSERHQILEFTSNSSSHSSRLTPQAAGVLDPVNPGFLPGARWETQGEKIGWPAYSPRDPGPTHPWPASLQCPPGSWPVVYILKGAAPTPQARVWSSTGLGRTDKHTAGPSRRSWPFLAAAAAAGIFFLFFSG